MIVKEETQLNDIFQYVRAYTESLCQPLAIEDYVIQGMPDVSPPKWHLAHTTWFFETFILKPYLKNYTPLQSHYQQLFNSYYQHIGYPFPRERRGLLARPTVSEVYAYRNNVDAQLLALLDSAKTDTTSIERRIELGIHHEQQHQELLLMDIKYNFFLDPTFPVYDSTVQPKKMIANEMQFNKEQGGLIRIGHDHQAFCFDNELPAHHVFLKPYAIANRLVTNGEYLEFVEAKAYEQPTWWLSDGWDCVQQQQWRAPLYWQQMEGKWYQFTLYGLVPLNLEEPVAHVSFYEADAYARFRQMRLPTEAEWEHHAKNYMQDLQYANFLEAQIYHPEPTAEKTPKPQQFFGELWEWTSSAYSAYPGYQADRGALGEYNGKFMSNQMVLRGGACVTPRSHIRATYRNFFQPEKRWQFSGIRLAKDCND